MLFPTTQTTQRPRPSAGRYGRPRRGYKPGYVFGSDHIGLTGFHSVAFVVAKPAPVGAPWVVERVRRLEEKIGGTATDLAAGLRVSVELLRTTWPGVLRRIWLISDGAANQNVSAIVQAVQEARANFINVNTVAFGDVAGEALLRQIAASTHNGRFVPARTLRELAQALRQQPDANGAGNGRHRRETTVVCVDVSKSMRGLLDGSQKIELAKAALLDLIEWKRHTFA